MERKLMNQLLERKNSSNRQPLLLEWARQVGKTHLLQEFWKRYFKNIAYVNLQNPDDEISDLFEGSIDPHRIVAFLELYLNMKIDPETTLLFFDEVQEVPRALTSLKYFCENAPEYHIVTAGSLLWIFLHQWTSFPVGKVDTMRLEPLDFEEFLRANGREKIVEYLKETPFANKFTEILYDLFKFYIFTGGMPKVVADWIQNRDIEKVQSLQEKIINDYRRDFSKYADGATAVRIRQIFDTLPSQFAKRNEKFLYETVKSGARAREYELAIEWLIDAGIIRKVHRVKIWNKIPLKAYSELSAFKLYFLDVWLFRFLADIPLDVILHKETIFDTFNGLLTEQFILQQLANYEMFYWTGGEESEVDFVMQYGSQIVPIEVKSWTRVKAKSLKMFREKFRPQLSVRFSLKNTRLEDDLLDISLYHSYLFEGLVNVFFNKFEEQTGVS